jgi:putative DNA methylase
VWFKAENTTNEKVLQAARDEIRASWQRTCEANKDHPRAAELFNPEKLPAFHDPFAGGGSLPLEAQRLGLEAYASDINPVAVLINKAMIEIPPRFANRPPVNPPDRRRAALEDWRGARGLAADVRYYGEWARTVRSLNPAFAGVEVPLASTFMLSTKAGKEAWVEVVRKDQSDPSDRAYAFTVRTRASHGAPPPEAKNGTSAGKRAAFKCVMSGTPITYDYIRAEGQAGRMGARLMAIVAEGERGRVYLPPTPEHEAIAREARPHDVPETELPPKALGFRVQEYGMTRWCDLFTPRQLVALTTFSDLVGEAMARVKRDALAAGLPDDGQPLRDGGTGPTAYAQAVGVYLAFAVSKTTDYSCALCDWHTSGEKIGHLFNRQAIPIKWDFCETNIMSDSSGNIGGMLEWVSKALETAPANPYGFAAQADAQRQSTSSHKLVSTDPPYYDNVGYADLSDFFYVWLRRSLRSVFPELFATLAVPKAEELVATPYRHGSKEAAERFFLDGMTRAMHQLAEQAHPAFPVTIYYAFKQQEVKEDKREESNALDPESHSSLLSTHFWPMI